MVGVRSRARRGVAAVTAAVLAFGALVLTPTAALAAPGDASAAGVRINLNAGVVIPPLVNIPLVNLTSTVGSAVAPAGGGTASTGLLGVNLAGLGVGATGTVDGVTATRTPSESRSAAQIAGVNVNVLGLSAVNVGAVNAVAVCPAGAPATADASVAGLSLLGQAVTLNATTPTVNVQAGVNVLGLTGAVLHAQARRVVSTTATTASAAAVVVDLRLTANVAAVAVDVNLGSIQLAEASCQAPTAVTTSMTPTTGPTSGGTTVTVTGTGLQSTTGVTFGGVPATSFTPAADGTSLTAVAPATEVAGAVPVVLARPTGNLTPGTFTSVAPTVTGVDPPQGSTAGGTAVTIAGTGLAGATGVSFGGTVVPVTAATATSVTATTPLHAAGTVDVTVQLPGADATAAGAYTFVAPTAPIVTGFTPLSGPAAGGTSVVLAGSNLGTVSAVTFGGVPGDITAQSAGSLTVTTPPHAPGAVPVVLTNPGGTTTATDPFTYLDDGSGATLTGVAPVSVPTAGGTTITVSGTGLAGATGVTVGGVAATDVVATGTTVTATVPASDPAGPAAVVVEFPAGTRDAGEVTYVAPTLTGATPPEGPAAGSTSVVLAGTGLADATAVTVDGVAAPVTAAAADGTSLTVTVPPHAPGVVDVVVALPGADAVGADLYTYLDDGTGATVTGVAPGTSPTGGGIPVTVTGTGLAGATGLTVGGVPVTDLDVAPDGTTVTGTVPATQTPGTVTVTLEFPAGSVDAGTITYLAPATPVLSPAQGPDEGGTAVTLTGTGLTGATGVTFDGIPADDVVVVDDGTITLTTPPHAAGVVDVVVALPGLDAVATGGYAYLLPGAPTVASVVPPTGPVAGGTEVTLTGTDLDSVTEVRFDGVLGTALDTDGDGTTLTVVTPPHAAGPVAITLVNPGGESVLPNGFTYLGDGTDTDVSSVDPGTAPTSGGTTVTLTGTGLTGATGLTVGGAAASDVVVAPGGGSLTATVPPSEAAGPAGLVVVFPAGTADAGTITYVAPTLTGIAPVEGPTSGGTTVALTGTGLSAASAVTFGGTPATAVTPTADGLSVTAPAHAAGPVAVAVTLPGADPAPLAFTYLEDGSDATVDGVDPDELPTSGGTVTVTGSGLGDAIGMTVGGIEVTDFDATDGAVTGTVPATETPGEQDVVLIFPAGEVPAGTVTLVAPAVTGIAPASGVTSGGTPVTVTGTGLGAATGLTVGGAPVTDLVVVDGTTITGTTPPGVPGAADVVVELPGADAVLDDGYTYLDDGTDATVTGLAPATVSTAGGTVVTVTGTGLQNVTGATVGGVLATDVVVSEDGTEVQVTVPPSETGGPATVTLWFPAGTVVAGSVTYVAPTLTDFDPGSGPQAGGTPVTLTGTGLDAATGVTFDGVAAELVTVGPDAIDVLAPAHAPGVVDVVVTLPGADAVAVEAYTYLVDGSEADVTGLAPLTSPTSGGGTLTVSGTGLGGATGVTVGGVPATDLDVAPDGTGVSVTIPPTATGGAAPVVVLYPAGSVPAGVLVYVAPTLTGVSPASGGQAGGETVTLTGTGLAAATDVTFGGVPVTDLDVDPDGTSITVEVPAHAPGTVDVVVVLPGADATAADGYAYLVDGSEAVVEGIEPGTVPLAGGVTVTISGSGLTGATGVTVGGQPAEDVVVSDDGTEITFTAPPGTDPGDEPVVVQFPGADLPAGDLTYADDGTETTITSLAPALTDTSGGDVVTVTGVELDGAVGLLVAGVPVTDLEVASDGTWITGVLPPQESGGPKTVVVVFAAGTVPAGAIMHATPAITAAAPAQGPVAGGTVVTLSGSALEDATAVTFGGVAASGVTVVPGGLQVVAPPHAPGVVDVVVTIPGADATLAAGYGYVPLDGPFIGGLTPDAGPTDGGTTVVLTGTGLEATTEVTFGGLPAEIVGEPAPDEVTVVTPPSDPGTVPVAVTTEAGTGVLPGAYTYEAPVTGGTLAVDYYSPRVGPTSGGQTVVVQGSGFVPGATTATFAGAPAASVTVLSDTTLVLVTPPGPEGVQSLVLEVTTDTDAEVPSLLAVETLTLVYEYVPTAVLPAAPTVTAIDPDELPAGGGTTVTVTGSGFVPGETTVLVCGVVIGAGDVAVTADGTALSFVAPACDPGTTEVVIATGGGTVGVPVTYFASGVLAAGEEPGTGTGSGTASRSGSGVLAATGLDGGDALVWVATLVVWGGMLLLIGRFWARRVRREGQGGSLGR